MRTDMKTAIWVVLALAVFGLPLLVFADDKAPRCQDQLKMVDALAREYDRHRDNAVREKVSYQRAYEVEKAARLALEKQIAALKAQLPPAPAEEKKPE